jgi:anti-sigma B factor antagonist
MSLKASTRQMGTVTVIDLSGKIVLGDGSSLLRETVKDLASRGQKKLLLNLADVSYIDSSGLGALVASFTTIKGQEGQIKLLKLTSKVHDLLQITKLLTVFDVFTDEATALKSFS